MVELALWIRVTTKQRVRVTTKQRVVVLILGICVAIVGQIKEIKETKKIVVFLVWHGLCSHY